MPVRLSRRAWLVEASPSRPHARDTRRAHAAPNHYYCSAETGPSPAPIDRGLMLPSRSMAHADTRKSAGWVRGSHRSGTAARYGCTGRPIPYATIHTRQQHAERAVYFSGTRARNHLFPDLGNGCQPVRCVYPRWLGVPPETPGRWPRGCHCTKKRAMHAYANPLLSHATQKLSSTQIWCIDANGEEGGGWLESTQGRTGYAGPNR